MDNQHIKMKTLNFLVLGKNKEILEVLKRLIENNEGWNAEILFDEDASYEYLKINNVDILLLSSGLDLEYEQEIKKYTLSLDKDIKVIDHYGGGSGLLKNEVYSLFPDLNS
ncbi:hypothetical protein VO54_01031 [Elizabethkingia miricola]|nr:hypothetical protein VO54_01031 [Elizabethkingia miricola]